MNINDITRNIHIQTLKKQCEQVKPAPVLKSFKEINPTWEDPVESVTLAEEFVVKSVDIEKRLFTAVVLRPNLVDAHGDLYDEDVVEKACLDYNENCMNTNLQHLIQTSDDSLEVIESFIAKSTHEVLSNGVIEGDWVMTMKVHDDDVWEMCKDGTFTGFSVGASGLCQKVTDSDANSGEINES